MNTWLHEGLWTLLETTPLSKGLNNRHPFAIWNATTHWSEVSDACIRFEKERPEEQYHPPFYNLLRPSFQHLYSLR